MPDHDPTIDFMRREAITLWRLGEQWTIAKIAEALRLDPPTVAGWIASRDGFKPFNGRLELPDGPAHQELRQRCGAELRELESALRQTVIETLESEIDEATASLADLDRNAMLDVASVRRWRLQHMARRLDSLRQIETQAESESPDD